VTAREPRDRHGDSRRVEFHINPQNVAGAEAEDQKERREKKKKGGWDGRTVSADELLIMITEKGAMTWIVTETVMRWTGNISAIGPLAMRSWTILRATERKRAVLTEVTLSSWLARDRSVAPYRSPVLYRCSIRFENKAEERKRSETIVSRYVSRDFTAIVDSWDVADRARSRDRGWDRPMKGLLDSQLKKKKSLKLSRNTTNRRVPLGHLLRDSFSDRKI